MSYIPRLQKQYLEDIRPALQKALGLKNLYAVPRLMKVVLNMGVKEGVIHAKHVAGVLEELMLIAGQRPVTTYAVKSVAGFKLRAGMPIGVKVTLRKAKMFDFLDRLVTIALPKVRDFRGLKGKSFDGCGNYSFGIREQLVFPEIHYDKVEKIRGMNIIICTSSNSDNEAYHLLKALNFPLQQRKSA